MTIPSQISSQLEFAKAIGLMPVFATASFLTGVDSRLLMAVASRESNMGLALDERFLGDGGEGIGIMQIDREYHAEYARKFHPGNHAENIKEGARILKAEIQKFGEWYPALAAYNTGSGDVIRALANSLDPDIYTTGGNYAKDVLHRYEIIKELVKKEGFQTFGVASIGMDTIAGLVLLSAAAGTAYLMVKNSNK